MFRVTAQQKAVLKRQATAAGLDLSAYVLSRVLPLRQPRFAALVPSPRVREAAARAAIRAGVPETRLTDAVKGFLGTRGDLDRYLERPHLQVFVAPPEYLLAMKCVAMRLGEEFHDLDDVRYLLRYLDIARADDALAIVGRYFTEAQVPIKTRLALEGLLPAR